MTASLAEHLTWSALQASNLRVALSSPTMRHGAVTAAVGIPCLATLAAMVCKTGPVTGSQRLCCSDQCEQHEFDGNQLYGVVDSNCLPGQPPLQQQWLVARGPLLSELGVASAR